MFSIVFCEEKLMDKVIGFIIIMLIAGYFIPAVFVILGAAALTMAVSYVCYQIFGI